MLLSSAGGSDCSDHCQTPSPIQIPWLHHLLAAGTAPTIVKHHGEFKYHYSIICWRPQLPLLLTPPLTTHSAPLDDLCHCPLQQPLTLPPTKSLLPPPANEATSSGNQCRFPQQMKPLLLTNAAATSYDNLFWWLIQKMKPLPPPTT